MSSIAAGMNAERTNRWLLIGAAVLAVVAGALVFVALANFSDDDGGGSVASTSGSAPVLVAKQDIAAGTQLDADMFETAGFEEKYLVQGYVSDPAAVVGRVTRVNLLEGQQLSLNYLGQNENDELREQLAFLFERGLRAVAMDVKVSDIVGGHLYPGDYVDVIITTREKENPDARVEFIRVQVPFQNIEVLARAAVPVDGVVELDESGQFVPVEPADKTIERRGDDIAPEDGAATVTLALPPDQAQQLEAFLERGARIKLALRSFGDEAPTNVPDLLVPVIE